MFDNCKSVQEALDMLQGKSKKELKEMATNMGYTVSSGNSKADIKNKIVGSVRIRLKRELFQYMANAE